MYFKPGYLKTVRESAGLSILEMATRAKTPCKSIKGVEKGSLPTTDSILAAYQTLLPTVDICSLSIEKPFFTRLKAAVIIKLLRFGIKLQG
ncbi:hypothetical protein ACFGW7_03640 [Pasteurella multocida]